MKMKTKTSFDDFLKRFVNEYLKGLLESFESGQHYLTSCMVLFEGWRLLKMFPEFNPQKFKAFEEIVKEIDQLDTTLGRPIEMQTLRSLSHNPKWREIRNKIRALQF